MFFCEQTEVNKTSTQNSSVKNNILPTTQKHTTINNNTIPVITKAVVYNKKSSIKVGISWEYSNPSLSVLMRANRIDKNCKKEALGIICFRQSHTYFMHSLSSETQNISLTNTNTEYMFGLNYSHHPHPRWSSRYLLEIIIIINDFSYNFIISIPPHPKTSVYNNKIFPKCYKIQSDIGSEKITSIIADNADESYDKSYDLVEDNNENDDDEVEDIFSYFPNKTTPQQMSEKSNKRKSVESETAEPKRRNVSRSESPIIIFENDTVSVRHQSDNQQQVQNGPPSSKTIQVNSSMFHNYRMNFLKNELQKTLYQIKFLKIRGAAIKKCIESQLEFEKIENELNSNSLFKSSINNMQTVGEKSDSFHNNRAIDLQSSFVLFYIIPIFDWH